MTLVLFSRVATAAFPGQLLQQFSCPYSGGCNSKLGLCNKYSTIGVQEDAAAFVCHIVEKRRVSRGCSDGKIGLMFNKPSLYVCV